MNQSTEDIRELIRERIQEQKVKMRPRTYFLWRIVGIYVLLGVLFFVSLFIISLIALLVEEAEIATVSGFIGVIPWYLAAVILVLIIIAIKLMNRSASTYRFPRLLTFIILLLIVFIGGVVVAKTPVFSGVFYDDSQEEERLRTFGLFSPYVQAGWVTGIVVGVSPDYIEVREDATNKGYLFKKKDAVGQEIEAGDHVLVRFRGRDQGRHDAVSVEKIVSPGTYTRSQ